MQITKRTGKAREALKEDQIPGVIYGKDSDSQAIQATRKAFLETLSTYNQNQAFDIDLEDQKYKVFIKDIQRDSFNPAKIVHFDLMRVSAKDKMTAPLPIVLLGKEEIEHQALIVQQTLDNIQAKYSVGKAIEYIEADISNLQAGEVLTVADLKIPEGVEVLTEPENVVVSIGHSTAQRVAAQADAQAAEAALAHAPDPAAEESAKEDTK